MVTRFLSLLSAIFATALLSFAGPSAMAQTTTASPQIQVGDKWVYNCKDNYKSRDPAVRQDVEVTAFDEKTGMFTLTTTGGSCGRAVVKMDRFGNPSAEGAVTYKPDTQKLLVKSGPLVVGDKWDVKYEASDGQGSSFSYSGSTKVVGMKTVAVLGGAEQQVYQLEHYVTYNRFGAMGQGNGNMTTTYDYVQGMPFTSLSYVSRYRGGVADDYTMTLVSYTPARQQQVGAVAEPAKTN